MTGEYARKNVYARTQQDAVRRFSYHCNFNVINGESYRMREREGTIAKAGLGRPRKHPAADAANESAAAVNEAPFDDWVTAADTGRTHDE